MFTGQRLRHATLYLCMWIAISVMAGAANADKPPHRLTLAVGSDRITIVNAQPGTTVLLVGYELTTRDYAPLHRQVHFEKTAGPDGTVEMLLGRELSPNAFWVAFDLATGAYGAAAGSRRALREAELRDEAVTSRGNDKFDTIRTRYDLVYTLVIRPGVGAWEGLGGDGGDGDADGTLNGNMDISVPSLQKIARTASGLDGIQRGDIVAVFVPHQMGFLITEVKK